MSENLPHRELGAGHDLICWSVSLPPVSALKAGRNWARIVLAILTVLQVISLVAGRGGSLISYLSAAAAVLALVPAFLPASNGYIAAHRR